MEVSPLCYVYHSGSVVQQWITPLYVFRYMEEELREGHQDPPAPALPLGPEPQSETERNLMDELGRRVRQQSSLLNGNKELQEYVVYI